MFDLLEKLFEVVATKAGPEAKMRTYWGKKGKINTKLTKSTWATEPYLKFWLLTTGDVVPVKRIHDGTASEAGVGYNELLDQGAFTGTIMGSELNLGGSRTGKFTRNQISKLRNLYIEYDVTDLRVYAKDSFGVPVKSSKELAYYLEYGKEKWESKIKDDLLEKIIEATASDIRRKHRSIKRLFPDFDVKTKGVEDKGGLRLDDQDASTWKFRIHSGTQNDLWYDAYLHFKNIKPTLERMVKDRRLWVADKSRVDLRKLAKQFMNKVDIQLFCSCPAFQYWGPAYILSLGKYDAKHTRREIRPPKVRNPKQYGMLCKHLDRLFKVLPFYGSTMAKWIKDFYSKDIAKWQEEAKEEFGWVKKAAAALVKKREEKPEVEEPEVEPEEEPIEEPKPVTKAMAKAIAKKEKPEEEPEEPKKEEPEEEPKEEKPKKRKPRKPIGRREKPPQAEWIPEPGERPEEEYF